MNLHLELDRQVSILIQKGYPALARLSEVEFRATCETLKTQLPVEVASEVDLENGKLPMVLVVKSSLVPTEQAMAAVEKDGKVGLTKLFPHTAADFSPIAELELPSSEIYVLLEIDRGKSTLNLPPNQAFGLIQQTGRFPLTIDEGVAIVTHYPEFLIKNNCFSLLGSRHPGDQRVPAIWINGQKHPNLGWCWDGNPHTWLGSASAMRRV